jgi:alkylhydroperoxidase family enzyme
MSTAPQPPVSADDLDALPTGELRARAVDLAKRRHDLGFFWDLLKHMPAATDQTNTADASAGGTFETLQEAVELVREWRTGDYGDREPLLRARFIDYLSSHA